jgi:hypothetical protein
MNLYILAIAHFCLAITLSIALPPVGISEIFFAMILLCIAYSMNFCMVIFYLIFMLQDAIQYFSAIGLLVQRGDFVRCYRKEITDKCDPFQLTVIILFFVFSIVAIAVSFYSYRVFKAMAMGQIGAGGPNGGMFMRGMNIPVRGNDDDDDEAPPRRQQASQPYQAPPAQA